MPNPPRHHDFMVESTANPEPSDTPGYEVLEFTKDHKRGARHGKRSTNLLVAYSLWRRLQKRYRPDLNDKSPGLTNVSFARDRDKAGHFLLLGVEFQRAYQEKDGEVKVAYVLELHATHNYPKTGTP